MSDDIEMKVPSGLQTSTPEIIHKTGVPKTFRAFFRHQASLRRRDTWSTVCQCCIPFVVMIFTLLLIVILRVQVGTQRTRQNAQQLTQLVEWGSSGECSESALFSAVTTVGDLPSGSANGTGYFYGQYRNTCGNNNVSWSPYLINVNYSESIDRDVDSVIYDSLIAKSKNKSASIVDGSLVIHRFDTTGLEAVIQFPKITDIDDNQNAEYYNQNGWSSNIAPSLIHLAFTSYARFILGISGTNIRTGIQQLAQNDTVFTGDDIINFFVGLFYCLATVFLFPSYVHTIVADKELRLRNHAVLCGLPIWTYWAIVYLFNFILFCVVGGIVLFFGIVTRIKPFLDPSIPIFLLLTWGHVQIAISFVAASVQRKNRTIGSLIMYAWVLGATFACYGASFAFLPPDKELPWYLLIFPHFAYMRAWFLLSYSCSLESGDSDCLQITDFLITNEIGYIFVYLWVQWAVYMLVAFYLDAVIPVKFGVAKHPAFPIKWLWKQCTNLYDSRIKQENEEAEDSDESKPEDLPDLNEEDEDVRNEREKIMNNPHLGDTVVVRGLSKIFSERHGKKIALNQVYFTMQSGKTYALLGPNGAGKTTLFNILTGVYRPSYGSVSYNPIIPRVGVCEQFDVIWKTLSVEEHLLFHARLKGVTAEEEAEEVQRWAQYLGLEEYLDRPAGKMSGGQQRRLCIANAMIGKPDIVFLDEPSSGIDPTSRRQLWEILSRFSKDRLIILTTHLMEEADRLADEILILASGKLQALGSSAHLKKKFGDGYTLSISLDSPDSEDRVKEFIHKLLPESKMISAVGPDRVFHSPIEKVGPVLKSLQDNQKEIGITNFAISRTTMEDVFINICKEHQ